MQRIITLTTDFGYRDYYVGALKGKIYSNISNCTIIDISHGITSYNKEAAGFVVRATYHNFPKGSIHIIAVDAFISENTPAICVKCDGHYFITTDNGVLTNLLIDKDYEQAVYIYNEGGMRSNDLFVYCAYQLSEGRPLENIGTNVDSLQKLNFISDKLTIEENTIQGKFVYEDNYGNLITNISREVFERVGKGRRFQIRVKNSLITRINNYYADFKLYENSTLNDRAGDLLAVFNDLDLLVITIFYSRLDGAGGSPRTLLNLNMYDNIRIDFVVENI
ncbi:SAM hydrolase/SAM-dependent halogenase family protein [Myroides pelagicus]|uniref:SAM-dependent chlorinase/fluorinase n=1 Tax=Myroides pelagicus TaxID=270914 RepID=A0A7K1GJT4_9FLAO|nr:SAM-dependent chlorinase/fluorinase [Myroides pelagicus]MEC4113816.1 SAM-dependent chlorinase/fluorinase [Myroides pelagicus]MTH29076.1 hypothetical protein [Myroides pelagicus]